MFALADPAGCSGVRGLFAPLSCRHFAANYFERQVHVTRGGSSLLHEFGAAGGYPTLLSSANLTVMSSYWQFKVAVDHSQARVLRPDTFSHDTSYADGSIMDAPVMRAALRNNRTIVLHNVELYWRPVGALSAALSRAFGVYVQANVYYARTGLRHAVHAHQDAQSVFVVQCEGRKRWELFDPPQRWRLRQNQRGKAGDVIPPSELSAPLADVTLAPGDVLFVPRGVTHRTSTLVDEEAGGEEPGSLHVTIGIETDTDEFTWLSVLGQP